MLFTLFGATGDLTTKKLIPALYRLYEEEALPENFVVTCVGRRPYTTEAFVAHLKSKMKGTFDKWDAFESHLFYHAMDMEDADAYEGLKHHMASFSSWKHANRIFYLATAPHYFPIVAKSLVRCGLLSKGEMREKIVFEKPFGADLETAKAYNKMLQEEISESQIYRIDHYLGKEMLQNILTVRFANRIFENIWSSEHIDYIKIYALEEEGVKERGGYYDGAGALKDMIQNHLFQTLALVAMDAPNGLNDEWIKDSKVDVMSRLKIDKAIVRGQYKGYLDEKGIPENSQTETFVGLKAYVETERWEGMPFYLVTGKRMEKKQAGVEIVFKGTDCFFEKGQIERNRLTIEIYPREGLVLQFNGKAPGLQDFIMPMKLDYCHNCHIMGNSPEAYEKLLLDCLNDDRALFTRWDEVEYAWEVVESMGDLMEKAPLVIYENGKEILERVNESWEELIFET